MTPSVRGQLEKLNRECELFCRDQANWSAKWHGTGPKGTANFRLLYSAPETFETPGRVMILGTNPGGDHTNADQLDPREPFNRGPDYSAYLDDRWPYPHSTRLADPGRHRIQEAVRQVAAALVDGSPVEGDELLRHTPSGNLIPFRSKNFTALPKVLWKLGFERFGAEVIKMARPRVLVLISSRQELWCEMLKQFPGMVLSPEKELRPGANRPFREAIAHKADTRPQFIWALPAVNRGTEGAQAIDELRNLLRTHGVRIAKSGLVRVSKQ